MASIFEMCMLIAFGCAWPASIIKSWRARTTVGKSPIFLGAIMFGYLCGITSKIVGHEINYVIIFYIIDFCMVSTDAVLYLRNRRLDRRRVNS